MIKLPFNFYSFQFCVNTKQMVCYQSLRFPLQTCWQLLQHLVFFTFPLKPRYSRCNFFSDFSFCALSIFSTFFNIFCPLSILYGHIRIRNSFLNPSFQVLEKNFQNSTATSAGKECPENYSHYGIAGKECPEHHSHLCLQISFPVCIEVSNCMCTKMSILAWKRAFYRSVTTTSFPSLSLNQDDANDRCNI